MDERCCWTIEVDKRWDRSRLMAFDVAIFLNFICLPERVVRCWYSTDGDPLTIKSATETTFLKLYEGARERGGKHENDFLERECPPSSISEKQYL